MYEQRVRSKRSRRALHLLVLLPCLVAAAEQRGSSSGVTLERIDPGLYVSRSNPAAIDEAEAEAAAGSQVLEELSRSLSLLNGPTEGQTNTVYGRDFRFTEYNLRGLGPSSTLSLLDGQRVLSENLSSLIPSIALQRVDISPETGSAYYGDGAVAGVVNFVPLSQFDGLRMELYSESDTQGDYDGQSLQLLWGGDLWGVDTVVAAQFRRNGRLSWDERNDYESVSPNFPLVTNQDCRTIPLEFVESPVDGLMIPVETQPVKLGDSCFFDPGDASSYREPTKTGQLFANASWEVNPDLRLKLQALHSAPDQLAFPSHPQRVVGDILGDAWLTDFNGNLLYGADRDNDGLADTGSGTDTATLNGPYLVTGVVSQGAPNLAEFVPGSPLNFSTIERVTELRSSYRVEHVNHFSLQTDFSLPFADRWQGKAAYIHGDQETIRTIPLSNSFIPVRGLICDVVANRDACYSPFFSPVGLPSTFVITPPYPPNLPPPRYIDVGSTYIPSSAVNRTFGVSVLPASSGIESHTKDRLRTLQLLIDGEFGLPFPRLSDNPVSAAFGLERRDNERRMPQPDTVSDQYWIAQGAAPRLRRHVDAAFAELIVPIHTTLDLELALRHEEFSSGQGATAPRLGLSWQPVEGFRLRASKSEGFVAPELQQLIGPTACGLGVVDDRFGGDAATGFYFVTQCVGGNPDLEAQRSDSLRLGFDLLLGDFDLRMSWNRTRLDDRIVSLSAQTINDLDYQAFQHWSGFSGDGQTMETQPDALLLQAWLASGLSDPSIVRDADNNNRILTINAGLRNVAELELTAIDLQSTYRFSLDTWGDISVNLQTSYIDEFRYRENPIESNIDGAGDYNYFNPLSPELPKLRAFLRLRWHRLNHSMLITSQYIDSMRYDGPLFTAVQSNEGQLSPIATRDNEVRAWADMDIAYSYRGLNLLGGEMLLTLGVRNVFDRLPQFSPTFAGGVAALRVPMGRMLFGSLQFDL